MAKVGRLCAGLSCASLLGDGKPAEQRCSHPCRAEKASVNGLMAGSRRRFKQGLSGIHEQEIPQQEQGRVADESPGLISDGPDAGQLAKLEGPVQQLAGLYV